VLRLGSAILASVLLGVPRALDARAFGARRSVYVQVAPASPELAAFAAELTRALGGARFSPAALTVRAPLIVEVHGLWLSVGGDGPVCEAVRLTAREGRSTRRLILRYPPGARSAASRALLRSLEGPTEAVDGEAAGRGRWGAGTAATTRTAVN
jgi:hypothetical protein